MNENMKRSFETMGATSYMTVTCQDEAALVNYKLQMLISNEIKNLLPVTKQMIDGETVLYYNITSRIPLSLILEKHKLSRKNLFYLIEGTREAIEDTAEFRLSEDGILMNPEYIYVNPANCAPAFVYMPVEDAKGGSFKDLLMNLIMGGKLEMSNDNFIQVLLNEVNRQPFSLKELEKNLQPYKENSAKKAENHRVNNKTDGDVYQRRSVQQFQNEKPESVIWMSPGVQPSEQLQQTQVPHPGQVGWQNPGVMSDFDRKPEIPGKPEISGKPERKRKPEKKQKTEKKQNLEKRQDPEQEFDAEAAKKKFVLPQAAVMVMTAAAISFGFFMDENGTLLFKNILAYVILVGVGEIVLYREVYVNSKSPKKSGKNKKAKKKAGKGTPEWSENKMDVYPQGRPPVPQGRPPVPQGRPSVPQGRPETWQGRPSVPQERPSALQGGLPVPQGRPPVPQGRPSVPQGRPPMPQGRPETWQGRPSVPQERPSALQGSPADSQYSQEALERTQLPHQHNGEIQQSARWEQPYVQPSGSYAQRNFAAPDKQIDTEDTDIGGETELMIDDGMNQASAYLEYYEDGRLTRIPVDLQRGVVVGRLKQEVDFQLKNPNVGKIHARFFFQDDAFYVLDINSKNGTYINESRTRIDSNVPYRLHDKDRIRLANSEFVIRCIES